MKELNKYEKRLTKKEQQNIVLSKDLPDFLNLEEWQKYGCKDRYNDDAIYVILNPHNKLHKIGVSRTPTQRCKNIGTMIGHKLVLSYAVVPMKGDFNAGWLEDKIHTYFASKRVYGEWFNLDYNDLENLYNMLCDIDDAGLLWPDEPEGVLIDNFEESYIAIDPERYEKLFSEIELD